jgi:ER lumen protein retaining receptor
MIQKCHEVETITGKYMASLGFYRFFYIINWVYKYMIDGHFSWVSALGGIL